eukprot:scaffold2204_cov166-Amphora_coffeaeformis.AAC.19
MTVPKEVNARRAGRRPSKDFDAAEELAEDFVFGCYENKVQMSDIQKKLEAAKKTVANGEIPEPKRRAPERSCSSDSYEDYHKKVFDAH